MEEPKEAGAGPAPRYYIDRTWFEGGTRDFLTFAAGRMCASCQEKLGTEVEERVARTDRNGKVVFERQMVPYGSNPFKVIRDCCSHSKGFITAAMPLQEAIFRTLLASGNQPLTPEELRDQLDEWFAAAGRRRFLDSGVLQRLMDHDRFYGIKRLRIPLPAAS